MPFKQRKLETATNDRTGIDPQKLSYANRKYSYTDFKGQGQFTAAIGYGNPVGTTGANNIWRPTTDLGGPLVIEYFVLGAGETILAPAWDATGYPNLALDEVNDEGAEYVFGGNVAGRGKHVYTIGTDKDFFARFTYSLEDASGTDECLFGFRKVQANQTVHTSYTDYFLIGLFTAADPGLIQIKTRLNTGTAVLTSTTNTFADLATKTFQVNVTQGGVASATIDDASPVVNVSGFTFDSGDLVEPIFFFLNSADVAGDVLAKHFSSGFLSKNTP